VVYLSGKWADYVEGVTYPAAGGCRFYLADTLSSERSIENNSAVFRRGLLAAMPNVKVLRPDAVLCTDVCAVEREGKVLYLDDNHLSTHGVSLRARDLEDSLAAGVETISPAASAYPSGDGRLARLG
jgi:hypothetical protein